MTTSTDAFFVQLDDGRYASTEHTTGPWDPRAQHGGGPTALLAGRMEQAATLPLVRVTMEILRPVPVAELSISVSIERPGRRITLVSGTLSDDDGPCILARAWGMRREQLDLTVAPPVTEPIPSVDGVPRTNVQFESPVGWHTAMDLRYVAGTGILTPGPGTVWGRPTVPLILGQEVQPIERVMLLADAGNGISSMAFPSEQLFINTELTVHLHRQPTGEWVGADAHSVYEPDGVGVAFTSLHDERGPIGRGAQALLLDHR